MSTQAQLEEYKMLREDILQRIRFRFQLFSLLFIVLGALLPVGLSEKNPLILFVYPIFAFFLSMSWVHQAVVMRKISRYLHEELEPKVEGLEWQAYVNSDSSTIAGFSPIGFFASSGFILFSQILLFILGLLEGMPLKNQNGLFYFMLIVAGIAILSTLFFLIIFKQMKR